MAKIRRLCNSNGVVWQMGELGKVDAGGGGTVAMYMANRNILTLDTGVPVLSMHAPIEVVSKLDCYMTQKAMKTFIRTRNNTKQAVRPSPHSLLWAAFTPPAIKFRGFHHDNARISIGRGTGDLHQNH